jgi:dipeptidase
MATYGYGPDGKSPYPFSVKPDKKLKITDVMAMARDQLEGTQFDLTAGTGKFAS